MVDLTQALKDILGDAYSEDSESKIKKVIGENFVDKNDFNKKNNLLKELQEKVAGKQEGGSEKDEYERIIASLKEESAKKDTNFNNYRLDGALKGAKAKNIKAIKALIDSSKLEYTDSEIKGLNEQIDVLKKGEDTAFLFDEEVEAGTGSFPASKKQETAETKAKQTVI